MNTTENNRMLADFLGYTQPHPQYPDSSYWYKQGEEPLVLLSFDRDWNWLIEVVEKVESLGYELFIETFEIRIEKYRETLFRQHTKVSSQTKIEAVYNACVEFVKWYNENK
jgi:hypothetical protein